MPETKSLFNRVAKHYDLLNTLFSLGMDKSWRKRLAHEVSDSTLALDIATGTTEVAVEIVNRLNECRVIGIDPSKEMLKLGHAKLKALGVQEKIILFQGFAENLPFKEDTFDAATISFGIRNTVDPLKSLQEMKRIQNERVSEKELEAAKKYLIGSFPMRLDTQAKLTNFLTQVEYYGLGLDYPERYASLIQVVTRDEVLRVAKTYLHPDNTVLVVVANLKEAGME